jgi:hypothetical protein
MSVRAFARRISAVLPALALMACGSTVQVGSMPPGPDETRDDGLSAGPPSGPATGSAARKVEEEGSTDGATPSTAAVPAAVAQRPTSTALPTGQRRDTSPVRVGFIYATNADALQSAGIDGVTTGDGRAQAAAITAWVNAHGGLGGRTLEPYFYGMDVAKSAANGQAEEEAACTAMTQDHHVFAVVAYSNPSAAFDVCLAKAHTILVDSDAFVDGPLLRQIRDYVYLPSDFLMERANSTYVLGLIRAGFLTPKNKVAVIYGESRTESKRILDGTIKPLLRRYGIPLPVTYGVQNADFSGAVLAAQSAGVDRVLHIALSPLFFMQAAESQQYHPRYGVNSQWLPGALLQTAAPRAQLAGSVGIGWLPSGDVDARHNPGPVSRNETLCHQILRAAGEDDAAEPTARVFALQTCDHVLFLKAALTDAPRATPQAMAAQVARLGRRFASASTFQADFLTGRPDGATAYRVFAFAESCSCYGYTGPPRPTT